MLTGHPAFVMIHTPIYVRSCNDPICGEILSNDE